MFRRRSPIHCHASGLHQLWTGEIVVSVGRLSNAIAGHLLSCDDEAQHWLGWRERDRHLAMPPSVAQARLQRAIRPASYAKIEFTALQATSGRALGHLRLVRVGETFEIGGTVLREVRGRGFGTDLMRAACLMALQHFGIVDLRAGCESTNVASMRWLTKTGFVPAPGPGRHTLDNGRVVDSVWWVHSDPQAKRECAYVIAEPGEYKRYPTPIRPDVPRQRTAGSTGWASRPG